MLEVVFSDSAAGSMNAAMGEHNGKALCAVTLILGDESEPDKEALEKRIREFQEKEDLKWDNAVPFEGKKEDILKFPLSLSLGEIDGNGICPNRKKVLDSLMSIYPGEEGERAASELLKSAEESLSRLLKNAGNTPIRIWGGRNPDDACGICWLMEQLNGAGIKPPDITLVMLPDFEEHPDGTVTVNNSWGELEPYKWGEMAKYGKRLPKNCIHAMAYEWRRLKEENSPLRAVVSGKILSVREDFYDFLILREIAAQDNEFYEARVIGKVLGEYRLGIGDAFIAKRIEKFIADGMLKPVSKPKYGDPVYHRILRKIL